MCHARESDNSVKRDLPDVGLERLRDTRTILSDTGVKEMEYAS